MNHVLCGLAANVSLPSELVDRLIAVADEEIAADLTDRADLSHAQAVALASRVGESAARLAHAGRLTAGRRLDLVRRRPTARKALREIATHPRASAPALLACLADPRARPLAAAHAALPPPVVEQLLTDADRRVAEAAAGNPSASSTPGRRPRCPSV
ncbi:hypothetical protein OIE82_10420 [Streptomyces althioticus]|uniref:DUF222 domain-containing protein n=1 Tax=Streptomyces althioticus TaxID=83380 RepID=A0ABZ1Y218_9ACTN